MISHGEPQYTYVDGGARIQRYSTPFVNELALGTVEDLAPGGHAIVSEGLFGIHVEVEDGAEHRQPWMSDKTRALALAL